MSSQKFRLSYKFICFEQVRQKIMDKQVQKSKETIQIKFQDLNQDVKIIEINTKGMNYAKLSDSIADSFQLEKSKLFRLYYIDGDQEQISVNTEEDYEIFLQNATQTILHLVITEDQDIHFRKFWHLGGEKTAKIKAATEFKEKLQVERRKMVQQLQHFRANLQERTKRQMLEKLRQIKQEAAENHRQKVKAQKSKRIGHFKSQIGCQSMISCQQKQEITGYRYKCIVCSTFMCEDCSEQQFKVIVTQHDRFHPLVQFKSDEWDDKIIAVIKKQQQSKQILTASFQKLKQQEAKQAVTKLSQVPKKYQGQIDNSALQTLDEPSQQTANQSFKP